MTSIPTNAWHVSKSIHNYDVHSYLTIKNPKYIDWEVTTIFYSALQLVDAYLLKIGQNPVDHWSRNNMVKSFLNIINSDYRKLYGLSKKARYITDITPAEKNAAVVYYTNISNYLNSRV